MKNFKNPFSSYQSLALDDVDSEFEMDAVYNDGKQGSPSSSNSSSAEDLQTTEDNLVIIQKMDEIIKVFQYVKAELKDRIESIDASESRSSWIKWATGGVATIWAGWLGSIIYDRDQEIYSSEARGWSVFAAGLSALVIPAIAMTAYYQNAKLLNKSLVAGHSKFLTLKLDINENFLNELSNFFEEKFGNQQLYQANPILESLAEEVKKDFYGLRVEEDNVLFTKKLYKSFENFEKLFIEIKKYISISQQSGFRQQIDNEEQQNYKKLITHHFKHDYSRFFSAAPKTSDVKVDVADDFSISNDTNNNNTP